ncbi:acyltransferase domain-containing protein [Ktedonospora formicarum]|uniref:Acyltransferase n=1 Tax=Ktedonospora formicarum TaxID=2778364 RepID=A0A8J3I8P7_9CHLR|nr:acyltransferase domain-containing protein [Ktedonospora formicarum]GHO48082.1 hypothetical protein KSX_62450 [Ktedonospora formicarum]
MQDQSQTNKYGYMKNDLLSAAAVQARLGLDDTFSPLLLELEAEGAPQAPVQLPAMSEVEALFERLGIAPADAAEIIEHWPSPERTPELWWLLERCHQQLVARMDKPITTPRQSWRMLPESLGTAGRLFYVYVFLATLPAVQALHQERGIPAEVVQATLADLGEHLAIHRRIFGTAGLDVPEWFTLHFRGILYRLGRLHFERWRFSSKWPIYDRPNDPSWPTPGAPALSLHIPESGGSISPAALDEALGLARDFFARYFPEEDYHFARCSSWLLDPQLAEYLPATSNVVQFQQRFHLVPGIIASDDDDVMRFVFRRFKPDLNELPQRTTLERAVVAHLRTGKHWQGRAGWFAL